jgi:hypothetical protein
MLEDFGKDETHAFVLKGAILGKCGMIDLTGNF